MIFGGSPFLRFLLGAVKGVERRNAWRGDPLPGWKARLPTGQVGPYGVPCGVTGCVKCAAPLSESCLPPWLPVLGRDAPRDLPAEPNKSVHLDQTSVGQPYEIRGRRVASGGVDSVRGVYFQFVNNQAFCEDAGGFTIVAILASLGTVSGRPFSVHIILHHE